MNSVPIYVTPDGRQVPIPAELAQKTKFARNGLPDRRLKSNAEFAAWADEQDKAGRPPKVQEQANTFTTYAAVADSIVANVDAQSAAQTYAMRVWNGQSPDTLTRTERIRRCEAALTAQNLPTEGVEYP